MPTKQKACFAYIRVSDFKQLDGASLQAQRDAIQIFAKNRGLHIVQWFEENQTAAKSGRSIFNNMIKQLNNKKAEGLLIHKIDRSSRNFADWAKIHDLSDNGVDIHFVTENLDFRTRGGQLSADIQAVFAADYIRNLKEEIAKGMNARLKEGLYPWKAPVGYLDNGKGKAKTIDPVKAPIVRQLFELYATGEHTMWSITDKARDLNLRTSGGGYIARSGIMRVLSNPFYTGLIHIKKRNETFQGVHKPLISQSLYQKVLEVREGRSVKKITKHRLTYRGIFKCGLCNTAMVGERKKSLVYYRCHTKGCATKTVREEVLETEIINNLKSFFLSADAKNQSEQWLKARQIEGSKEPRSTIEMQLKNIDLKKEKLTDALIDGLIKKDEYEKRNRELLVQASQLRDVSENRPVKSSSNEKYQKILGMLESLSTTYFLAIPDEKRVLIKNLFSECTVIGKSPYFKPHMWCAALVNGTSGLYCAPDRAGSRSYYELQVLGFDAVDYVVNCTEVQSILGIIQMIEKRTHR